MPMPSARANRRLYSLRATTGCCSCWVPWVPRFCVTAVWCFRWQACVIAAAFCAWGRRTLLVALRNSSRRHALVRHAAFPLGRRARKCLRSALSPTCISPRYLCAGARYHAGLQARDPLDFVSTDGTLVQKHDGLCPNSGVNPKVKDDGTIEEAPCRQRLGDR